MSEPEKLRKNELRIEWSGERSDDPAVVGEFLTATNNLLRALAEAACGDPDAIRWKIGHMGIVCDGCRVHRPDEHSEWQRERGLDFCPRCKVDGSMERVLAGVSWGSVDA